MSLLYKKGILFVLLFFSTTFLFAQYQLQINYNTNNEEINNIVLPIKNNFKSEKAIHNFLNKQILTLHKFHYTSACIDSIWNEGLFYQATIFVGNNMKISSIDFNYIDLDSTELQSLKIEKRLTKQIITIPDLLQLNDNIVVFLSNNGYPFASVQISEMQPTFSGFKVCVDIEKNNFIVLDSIVLDGNARLANSFLYGYLKLKRKKPYQTDNMNKVYSRLQNLNYIQLTRPNGVVFSEDKAALYIFADKNKINRFEGFLGLVPNDETSGKLLFTGNLDLNLNNIFHIGENIQLSWKRIQIQSQTLNLSVDFPYLFYSSFAIDACFALEKRDTSYLNLDIVAGVRYYAWENGYVRTYYEYQNSQLINNQNLQFLTFLPQNLDYTINWYGLSLNFKHLDYIFNPRKGYNIEINTAIGKKMIQKNINIPQELYNGIQTKSTQIKAIINADLYFPIKKRWTWVIALKSAYLQSPTLCENELFKIGGLNSLRGFDHQSIYASSYFIINNEIRFLFAKKSYLQAFFDFAGYEKRLTNNYRSDFPFGFGIGIAFDTKAGIFSLNYALGKQLGNPIKFASGKINFGYTAVF